MSKRQRKKLLQRAEQAASAPQPAPAARSPDAALSDGRAAFERGAYEEAIRDWREARRVSASPRLDRALAEAHFRQALVEPRLARRSQHLHEAAGLAPEHAIYQFHLGLVFHGQGQPGRARDAYERALRQAPGDARILRHLALALLADPNPASARQAASVLAGAGPRDEAAARLRAIACLRQHDPEAAVAILTAGKPLSLPGTLALGAAYMAAGQSEAAEATLGKVLRSRQPLHAQTRAVAALALVVARVRAGDLAGAAVSLGRQVAPADAEVRSVFVRVCRRLAAELAMEERFAGAVGILEQALAAEPGHQATRHALAHLRDVAATQAARVGDYARAAEHWAAALADHPTSARLLQNLALAEERLERWQEASAHWEDLTQRWRKELHAVRDGAGTDALRRRLTVAYRHLAETIEASSDYRAAARTLERALNLDPANDELRLHAAELYLDEEEYGPAIDHLRRVLASRPDDTRVLTELGSAYDLKGDDRRAEECLERALSLEADNQVVKATLASVCHGRGHRHASSGQHARALAEYQRALTLDPTDSEHYVCSGEAYLALRQAAAAEAAFKRAFFLRPRNPAMLITVARAYLRQGYGKQADKVFGQALRLDRSILMRAIVGLAYLSFGDAAKAEPHFKRVLAGRDASAAALVGKTFMNRQREAEAIPYLERAVALSPWSVDAHLDLAYAYAYGRGGSERAMAEITTGETLALAQGRGEVLVELSEAKQVIRYMEDPGRIVVEKPWLR